jgi:hypothetical protein
MAEYRLVGAGGRRDGGVQATGRPIWRGVLPAATEQRGEGEGDLRPDCRICVFSHRQSGPVPAFLSFGVPERAPGDRGWPGLAGWINVQIRGKTRSRGRDWAIFRRPDEKMAAEGLAGLVAGDALRHAVPGFAMSVVLPTQNSVSATRPTRENYAN